MRPAVFETLFTRSPATTGSCFPASMAQADCPVSHSHPGGFFQILPVPCRSPLIADILAGLLSDRPADCQQIPHLKSIRGVAKPNSLIGTVPSFLLWPD